LPFSGTLYVVLLLNLDLYCQIFATLKPLIDNISFIYSDKDLLDVVISIEG
jgi:hypothetical protein